MTHAADLPVLDFSPVQALGVRFSYASDDDAWGKRTFIRAVERFSGQPILRRAYESWTRSSTSTENIFAAGLRYLNIKLAIEGKGLEGIPKSGGLVVVANHPFGVGDGLALCHMLTKVRPDVKLLCHSLLCQPKEAENYLLPIDFSGSPAARAKSARTRMAAMEWLKQGHCIAVFPGGAVATRQEPLRGSAIEHPWHGFTGKLASALGVSVLPVYFRGENSALFHLASHFNYPLRVALLFRETLRLMGKTITAVVGETVQGQSLPHANGRDAVATHLHRLTLETGLGTQPAELPNFVWPTRMGNP